MAVITTTTGKFVPLHFDDRYYVGNCPECGEEVFARTILDIEEILEIHC